MDETFLHCGWFDTMEHQKLSVHVLQVVELGRRKWYNG